MRTLISFSGGETSGYLSWLAKQTLVTDELLFVFANTGQEHPKTLDFVDRCDNEFDLGVVWVEAHAEPPGTASTHDVVDYATACRDHRLFEEMCQKYGLPNPDYPHCTRELKMNPIHSFVREHWNGEPYRTAIGIRADEYRRVSRSKKYNVFYPLVDKFVTKEDVKSFWKEQSFNLGLLEHQGNCRWCWKKSFPKHYKLIDEDPTIYNVPRYLEKYNKHGCTYENKPIRKIFYGERNVDELFQARLDYIERKKGQVEMFNDLGCSGSCEMYKT